MIDILEQELRTHASACQELLRIAAAEHAALRSLEFRAGCYDEHKKKVLSRLEVCTRSLRVLRQQWQNLPVSARAASPEIQRLVRVSQQLAMKVIVLDRENEQALLRRGVIPPSRVAAASGPAAHFVPQLYLRHSAVAPAASSILEVP